MGQKIFQKVQEPGEYRITQSRGGRPEKCAGARLVKERNMGSRSRVRLIVIGGGIFLMQLISSANGSSITKPEISMDTPISQAHPSGDFQKPGVSAEPKPKDNWDKADITGKILISILIPIVIAMA